MEVRAPLKGSVGWGKHVCSNSQDCVAIGFVSYNTRKVSVNVTTEQVAISEKIPLFFMC